MIMNIHDQFNEIFKDFPERSKEGAKDCLDNKPPKDDVLHTEGWATAYEYMEKVSHEHH